jgi:hypothetical protein
MEPRFFRAGWLTGSYADTTLRNNSRLGWRSRGWVLQRYVILDGRQPDDLERVAEVLVDIGTGVGAGVDEDVKRCLRLSLGTMGVRIGRVYLERLRHEYDMMKTLARSADLDGLKKCNS